MLYDASSLQPGSTMSIDREQLSAFVNAHIEKFDFSQYHPMIASLDYSWYKGPDSLRSAALGLVRELVISAWMQAPNNPHGFFVVSAEGGCIRIELMHNPLHKEVSCKIRFVFNGLGNTDTLDL